MKKNKNVLIITAREILQYFERSKKMPLILTSQQVVDILIPKLFLESK